MKVPTLQEMVQLRPQLYDAMRERDSAANRVCALIARGAKHKLALDAWKTSNNAVNREVKAALEAFN